MDIYRLSEDATTVTEYKTRLSLNSAQQTPGQSYTSLIQVLSPKEFLDGRLEFHNSQLTTYSFQIFFTYSNKS